MRVFTIAERPDLAVGLRAKELEPGPAFLVNDVVAGRLWSRLLADFPEYQIVLVEDERVIAKGHSIPFRWTRTDAELPATGWDFVLERGCADFDAGRAPTAVSALAIVVASDRLNSGLSRLMLQGLREVAASHGLPSLFAPVRPTLKARYPLISMADYITWTLPGEQAPFDPWLRVHWRLGGHILHPCQESMMITGTVADWEEWSGLCIPASGSYVVAGALAPVRIDHERDIGRYVEPNVWVRHDVDPA